MSTNTLSLSDVCAVSVSVSPVPVASPTFNQGLIVGTSTVIPTTGANSRCRLYTGLAGMTTDGFSLSSPEYLAAELYFGQTPAPQYLWVGVQGNGETPLQALQACRTASPNWWGCMVTDAVTSDHEAIAAWIQAITPTGMYFFTTADAAVLNNTAGNVFLTLQAAEYTRCFGIYSTTQSGAAPNNAYACAAALGAAMGLNTGLANSYFTMKFKQLVGVIAEPLTQTQVTSIEASAGNVYVNYANTYNWIEQGVVPSGEFLDEILNLDMLASDMQYTLVNLLISSPSIPQTNAGETQLIAGVNAACQRAVTRGFLAPGTYTGSTILTLTAGTALPKGYLCQADTFANQSAADRAARKAMPIYATVLEAGSMHSSTIGIDVQR